MMLAVLTLPFHAFLGSRSWARRPCSGATTTCRAARAGGGTVAPRHPRRQLAGGILWASGDLIGLALFAVLFVQWVRSSQREAEREDRRLDLLEARDHR